MLLLICAGSYFEILIYIEVSLDITAGGTLTIFPIDYGYPSTLKQFGCLILSVDDFFCICIHVGTMFHFLKSTCEMEPRKRKKTTNDTANIRQTEIGLCGEVLSEKNA